MPAAPPERREGNASFPVPTARAAALVKLRSRRDSGGRVALLDIKKVKQYHNN